MRVAKIIAMITQVTSGIKISVETFYQPEQSNPIQFHYFFAYRITIENTSEYTVQLKRRHWFIFDSNSVKSEVEGEGVIGEQPVLSPGDVYKYISGCNLNSEIGKMHGYYLFEKISDDTTFHVEIPQFIMEVPAKMN